ncbi:tape measure protein [Acinetobacter sp. Ver3]|uniref:tape measure protein n=1 Tax=Acinetobacter sp. Ver3 TaxID=466088 RepID=UPI0004484299|nr:tape measure protein [Acinetobacter sp. Ver3]EZQ10729.1 phage tail length tape measure protein [Acinetobacter sp. Ver3]
MAVQESKLVIKIDSGQAARDAKAISKELESIEKHGVYATKSMDAASVAIRQLAGTVAGLVTVSTALNKIDTYTNLNNQLKLVTNSQEELNKALDDTYAIAQRSAASWEAVNSVYAKYMSNAKTLNLTQDKAAKLTEVTAKAVALSGSSAEAATGALFQYGQALDGNILRAEEYNSLVDGAGGLLNAMATGLNVTRGELRQMMLDGKLTGEVITEALLKASDSVDQLYAKTDTTIGGSLQMLSDSVTKFAGEAGQASGGAAALSASIRILAENFNMVASAAMVVGAYYVGSLIPAIYASTVAGYGKAKQLAEQTTIQLAAIQAERAAAAAELKGAEAQVANTQSTLAALQAERALEIQRMKSQITAQGLVASQTRLAEISVIESQVKKELTVANTALAASQMRVNQAQNMAIGVGRGLLGILGGPVGLGLTVATVAASYLLLKDSSDDTTQSLRANNETVQDAIEKYTALDTVKRRQQLSSEKDQLEEASKSYENLSQKLTTNAYSISRHNDLTKEQAKALNLVIGEFKKTGDLDSFSSKINSLNFVSQDSKNKFNSLAGQVRDAGTEFKNQKQFVDAIGQSLRETGSSGDEAARGVRNAANAVAEYTGKLKAQEFDLAFINALTQKHGKTAQEADLLLQAYRENEKKGIKGITVEQKKIISNIEAQRRSAEAYNKAQSQSVSDQKKQSKDSLKSIRNQAELRNQILFEYSDREAKMYLDLERRKAEIREAYAQNPAEMNKYLDWADRRFKAEKALYDAELANQLYSFKLSETEKLNLNKNIEEMRIRTSGEYTQEEKASRIKALNEQQAHELALIKLSQEQRIFQIKQNLMTETAAMEERYRLERDQILLNSNLTQQQKQKELNLIRAAQQEESRNKLNNAIQQWGQTQAQMNGTGNQFALEQERFGRYDQSQKIFDNELSMVNQEAQDPTADLQAIAQKREEIWQAHQDRMKAIESAYQTDSMSLQLSYGQEVTGALAGMFGAMLGESSSAYRALYGAQQAFALSQAGMNVWKAASDAYANEPGTVWQKMGAAALATVESGTFVSLIQAATPKGFADGGFTGYGGKYEPAGIVHKGEGVLTKEEIRAIGGPAGFEALRESIKHGYSSGGLAEDTRRVGIRAVNAINSGGSGGKAVIQPKVVINNYSSEKVETSTNQDGELMVTIGKMVNSMVDQKIDQRFIRARRQGGELYGI